MCNSGPDGFASSVVAVVLRQAEDYFVTGHRGTRFGLPTRDNAMYAFRHRAPRTTPTAAENPNSVRVRYCDRRHPAGVVAHGQAYRQRTSRHNANRTFTTSHWPFPFGDVEVVHIGGAQIVESGAGAIGGPQAAGQLCSSDIVPLPRLSMYTVPVASSTASPFGSEPTATSGACSGHPVAEPALQWAVLSTDTSADE